MSPRELKYGIPVTDENGNRLGESANAAKQAIVQVVVSRIGMAVPAMGNSNLFAHCFAKSILCCLQVVFQTDLEKKHIGNHRNSFFLFTEAEDFT